MRRRLKGGISGGVNVLLSLQSHAPLLHGVLCDEADDARGAVLPQPADAGSRLGLQACGGEHVVDRGGYNSYWMPRGVST